jgi:prophage regulatory protein
MKIMRLNEVMDSTGLGRSSIYKFIAAGTFPKPVSLGDRAVGWVDYEIEEWIVQRVAERDKTD